MKNNIDPAALAHAENHKFSIFTSRETIEGAYAAHLRLKAKMEARLQKQKSRRTLTATQRKLYIQ